MQGWIKLHRKIVDWEWYDDLPTKALFIHLLILANHEDNMWHGKRIEKGSLVTSVASLSTQTGLSIKQVRTALNHLEKTGEIGKQTTNQNTLIIVLNYDRYQEFETDEKEENGKREANSRQARGKQRATNNNDKNDNNVKNDKKDLTISNDIVCQTRSVRPEIQNILSEWNSLSQYGIKPVLKIQTSSKRYKMLNARLKEYSTDDVLKAIENIRNSEFLKGNNDRGWIITFDWFVRPDNFPKVFEDNYANQKANKPQSYCEY